MSTAIQNKALLDTLTTQTEQHIVFAIQVLQNLDETTLLRPSASGGWSIAQCLWHLNSYGDFYLPRIKVKLEQDVTEGTLFKSSWIGAAFTRMMQPGKGTYKAFKDHIPPATPDAFHSVAEFIRQQEELLALYKKAAQKNLNTIRINISISKWIRLKLGDVFSFLVAHNERHLQQAKRNLG